MALQRQGYDINDYGFGGNGLFNIPPVTTVDGGTTVGTVTVTMGNLVDFGDNQNTPLGEGQISRITGSGFLLLKQRQSLNSLPDALRATHLIGLDDSDAPCVLELVGVINDSVALVKRNIINDSITALDFIPASIVKGPCTSIQLSATAATTYQYATPQNLSTAALALTTTEPLVISNPQGIEPILIIPADITKVNLLCTWGAY